MRSLIQHPDIKVSQCVTGITADLPLHSIYSEDDGGMMDHVCGSR